MSNSMGKSKRYNSAAQQEQNFINAPYNFIEINEEVFEAYSSPLELPDPRVISDELLSGEISYSIVAKAPIVFEESRLYAIKNNTLTASMIRGLVRSNAQILSFSSVDSDIADGKYKFRKFTDEYYRSVFGYVNLRDRKNNQDIDNGYKNVRAGLIRKTDKGYIIVPSKAFNGRGFKTIKLTTIQSQYRNWREQFNVYYERTSNVFDTLEREFWSRYNRKKVASPFIKKVSWKENEFGDVVAIGEEREYDREAYLVNPSNVYGNVSMYLIPVGVETNNEADCIELSEDEIKDYLSCKSKQADRTKNYDYQRLPLKGEKPVFYVLNNGKCEFGFTCLFPIHYLHSVKEGIPESQKKNTVDYCKAIFGFHGLKDRENGKSLNYSGRVSFLEPQKDCVSNLYKSRIASPSPKPFSIINYVSSDDGKGYNSEQFRINGIKQYWLHGEDEKYTFIENNISMPRPVVGDEEGTRYRGKILFNNLTEDELGLLIWSIRLNEGCDQNIGAGKQYGYGRINVSVTEVERYMLNPVYEKDELFSPIKRVLLNPDNYVRAYQKKLNEFLGGNLEKNERLQSFFIMKNSMTVPDSSKTVYEFNRGGTMKTEWFPSVTDVVNNQKWLVIPESIIERFEPITWEQFLQEPPTQMWQMLPEMKIYNAYKDLTELMNLYKANHHYMIRQELFREFQEVLDLIEDVIKEKKGQKSFDYKSAMIEQYIETCIQKIYELSEVIRQYRSRFIDEAVPQLMVSVKQTVLHSEEKKIYLVFQLTVPEISPLVRVNYIQFAAIEGSEYFDSQKCFLVGGESKEIEAEFTVEEAVLDRSYVRINLKVGYQYRVDDELKVLEYEDLIEIPLMLGEYRVLENPYSSWLGNPVSDKNMFFGRSAMLYEIIEKIESCSRTQPSGRNIIIYGQKRTGKSTLLYFLQEELRSNETEKYVVINIGNVGSALQIETNDENPGKVNLRLFFRRMIDAAEEELADNHEAVLDELEEEGFEFPDLRGVSDSEAMQLCEGFYKKLSERLMPHKRLILLIDEFTYFYDMIIKRYVDTYFMQYWKAFIQNTKICAVLIGQDYMDDFRNRFANEFGASDHMRISYLDKTASEDLIRIPFRKNNGYEGFNEESVKEIIRLTAGSAFYIMHICSALISYINAMKRGRVVTEYVLNDFLHEHWFNADSPRRLDRSFFEALYNDGTHPEWDDDNLAILHEIAVEDEGSGADKENVITGFTDNNEKNYRPIMHCREKIDRLIFRDVLSERNGRLRIKVGLLTMWLKELYW